MSTSEDDVQGTEPKPKVTDSSLEEYNTKWWAELDPYHRKKVLYLGRLVDCSNPQTYKEWWSLLDANNKDPVRGITEGAKNLDINPTTSTNTLLDEKEKENRVEADASAKLAPYESIKAGSGFHLKRKVTASSKKLMKYEPTATITFRRNTDEDPNGITGADGTHHTEFEEKLCKYILSEIETKLQEEIEKETEGEVEVAEAKGKLESIKKKLDELMKEKDLSFNIRFQKFADSADCQEESLKWRMIANACTSYMYIEAEDFCCTHYVDCITLGTTVQESEILESKMVAKSGKGEIQGSDMIDAKFEGEAETSQKSKSTETLTRGTDKKQEVIAITTKAVSDLISNKSHALRRLKEVVAKLIYRHHIVNKAVENEAGPLVICCKKKVMFRDKEIYWQVIEEDNSLVIHGTMDDKKASHFYIQYINRSPPQFYIIFRPDPPSDPLYVTVIRPFNAHLPLLLVRHGNHQDVSFTMEASIQGDGKHLSLPDTTDDWTRQKPVFLKLPCGCNWLSWIWRAERYVGMLANGKTYKTVSYHIKQQKQHENMMLFSFKDALSIKGKTGHHSFSAGPPPPPKQVEAEDEIINWSDDDEMEYCSTEFYDLLGEDYVFPFQIKP